MAKAGRGLTQQQWTNVIIFVMSVMVLLFFFIGKVMERNIDKQEMSDRPVELVRIDFGGVEIWRENQNWLTTESRLKPNEARLIAEQWQRLVNQPGETYQSLPSGGRTVLLYFSSVPQPVVSKIINQSNEFQIAFITTQQIYLVPNEQRQLYIPEVN